MPETAAPILEVRDLRVRFGGVQAVDGATFAVREGSITALIGPNGAGKTTAFNLLTGFIRADGGHRRASPSTTSPGCAPTAIARLGMVRTFQLTRVLGKMTVLENVMLGAPDQPGAQLATALFRPRALAAARGRGARAGARAARARSASRPTPTPTPPRCRAASASCSSSRARS